ncbi:MAG: FAD-binding oxidoreductase [Ectothiorhodospiraceae bacterium]|nr:FAD-binding oxidoreductase [Ectothiorhodospiraceae bacterium]
MRDDVKTDPWWWEDAPRPAIDSTELPVHVDVLVVGSGYTGLHAAIQTARAGRSTLVLDAEALGWGCSARNGGQISTSIKPTYEELERLHGHDVAFGVRHTGIEALDFMDDFVRAEGIDCDFGRVGRFHGAHVPAQYEELARAIASQPKGLEVEAHMVPRAEQHREIGSDLYHGGVVYSRHAACHPAKYHLGLLRLAREAGATLVGGCRVDRIEAVSAGFHVTTPRGKVTARDVVVATNGYTGAVAGWQRRRVIPIGSYMIATEALDPALAREISPTRRVMSDSRKLVFYYRLCPQGRHMLFGGRVALKETDPRVSGPLLHASMSKIFPQLASTRITHTWNGFVAYTFDTLAHIGKQDGIHYAMGYCGSGVSMASYFGMRLGLKVLGSPEGKTAFDDLTFQTRPLYTGDPWFLAPAVMYYKLRDRLNI